MKARRDPPDQAQRDAAIAERERNVLVDAGAGTGKTTLLVNRLVEMIAPEDDGPRRPLSRIAAVTFTRKAAGELRLRIRERILGELARFGLSKARRDRLSDALATIDTAYVGTIHSLADRLLRLRPVEAAVSPTYEVVEEADALVHETFELLLGAAQAGTLAQELDGRQPRGRCDEAQQTLRDAVRAEIRAESKELEWATLRGLDALVGGFVSSRDVPPADPDEPALDLRAFRNRADELRQRTSGLCGAELGTRWLVRTTRRIQELLDQEDPVALFRELGAILASTPRKMRLGQEFGKSPAAWEAWKAWNGDDGKNPVRNTPLRDDLCAPLHRWMALRLARTFPVVIAAYEKVKARHDAVDQIDLLLKLRDLLRGNLDVRKQFQQLFDHVFVDEFQDTDPLQAEIVLYLCEAKPKATTWREIRLLSGKLTVVGDPKQSIYRFRRADVAMYEAVRGIVEQGPHLSVSLSASFRSEPALLAWFNDRFDAVLGASEAGAPVFDAEQGTVTNQHLQPFRGGAIQRPVKVLSCSGGANAVEQRAVEGTGIATWLRSVVDGRRLTITDPLTRAQRPAGYGDVAVLAASTFNLRLFLEECDRLGVPTAARGGTMFLKDPLHRQFLLALRAVADRDDGVALAALLRPPFFAIDVGDLARARSEAADDAGVRRARAALEWVRELRRRRLSRSPGQTARDLLDETGFGRHVALGPNGTQRLARLRELCLELERLAAVERLDYDAATSALRAWAIEPVAFDPPRPVGAEAVQVLSIHQAKGLEFPVVVLWDGCALWADRNNANAPAWYVSGDGKGWVLRLDGIEWEEPAGAGIAEHEKTYREAERKRLVYVAATRARDVLVVPLAVPAKPDRINSTLAAGAPDALVETLEAFGLVDEPRWAKGIDAPPRTEPEVATKLAAAVEKAWTSAAHEVAQPLFAPAAVSSEAHAVVAPTAASDDEAGSRRKYREGRFGPEFGDVVHHAIGIVLASTDTAIPVVVAREAREVGLATNLAEAAADVERALVALEAAGLRRVPGPDLQLEYPVAVSRNGKLLVGYVDLLSAPDGRLDVIDFKTDQPPTGDVNASHPDYVAQVRTYGQILQELGVAAGRTVRCGLLFTADGVIRWV